ncbi:DinB family protein [Flavihumibacter profundi]|uniref:DinB family protein n=1 Tax=Flavihumibacter profundi TaxID=2716883 RepID=UPI001CC41C8F|nr:DinB family protein [Flavihumibacter profundi]MBZ5858640.1 DinB family protein [Flavihumibacter profundi]
MKDKLQSIISGLHTTMYGKPWFGRSFFTITSEIDPSLTTTSIGVNSHKLVELVYHILTWSEFTLLHLRQAEITAITATEKLDWREIDPAIHKWQAGLDLLHASTQAIIQLLNEKTDEILEEKVEHRDYNFEFLLNGLIQHNIYHLGQIASLAKILPQQSV